MYILDIADKPEVPLEQRRDERMLWYRAAGPNGVSTISARTIRRAAHKRRALLLIKYLDGRDMQSRSIWLRRSQFKGSGRTFIFPLGCGVQILPSNASFINSCVLGRRRKRWNGTVLLQTADPYP